MGTSTAVASITPRSRVRLWLGIVLLAVGLLGHLLAAHAIGGTHLAYRDHMLGFVVLTLVSGVVVAALGWWFWRGRHDITVLAVGTLQALLGLAIYLDRFRFHG